MTPVKAIGRNVTGVQGDAANLADLDRLYETVKKEKGYIVSYFASAGQGGQEMLGSVTEEQFDTTFGLNVRGTLFTVQKALPLFRDGGSIVMTGRSLVLKACRKKCLWRKQGSFAIIRTDMAGGVEGQKDSRERDESRSIDTPAMEIAPPEMIEQFGR